MYGSKHAVGQIWGSIFAAGNSGAEYLAIPKHRKEAPRFACNNILTVKIRSDIFPASFHYAASFIVWLLRAFLFERGRTTPTKGDFMENNQNQNQNQKQDQPSKPAIVEKSDASKTGITAPEKPADAAKSN